MTTSNPLNGRGTAVVVAAPTLFAISEVLFHAHPIVGGGLALLTGMVAYRHWDDFDRGVEKLKEGTLRHYNGGHVEQDTRDGQMSSARARNSQGSPVGNGIPIGRMTNGKTFERDLPSLKNMIILGLPGGGKTNTAVHIMKHAIRRGARIAVIDKHALAGGDESLTSKIAPWEKACICPVGRDPKSSATVISQVRGVLDARLEEGEPADPPLVLVVDEYSAIMRQKEEGGKWGSVGEELSGLIEDILSGGRKAKIFCVCIGQISNVSRTGGSEIRELFSTRIAHAMSAKQAGLFGFGEQKNLLTGLGAGEVFIQTEGMPEPVQLMIRYESEQDIENEGTRIPDYEPIVFEERDTEELEELDITHEIKKPQTRRATLSDAIEVWNELNGGIGRPTLREELRKRGLECSDDLAGKLLTNIKSRVDA